MNALIQHLISNGTVVTDGAWGTQLQAAGLAPGECSELWNLERPDQVERVARSYVEAGSRIILTNTIGANRFTLARHHLAEQTEALNKAGVELSRKAANGKAAVFASMGPSGKLLAAGEVTEDELDRAFAEQARALAATGADAILIETMSDLEETALAIRAARQTGLPVVACMVFDSGKDKDRTMMGTTPELAAAELTEAGADVIGANCAQGIAGLIPICRRLRAATDRPIWIKPNAGLPEIQNGRTVYRTTAAEFGAHVPELARAGANFIGGCCGTNPEFVRTIQRSLQP